jgi:predicted Zn-dependent protease
METLVETGYDAEGMPRMFSRMLESQRYNTRRPPEFLLSHPVTENRVADSRNRARNYPSQGRADSLDFQLMRARVQVSFDDTPMYSVKRFRAEIDKDGGVAIGNIYGLVLALIRAHDLESARHELQPLLKNYPDNIPFVITASDIDVAAGQPELAVNRLARQLALNPGNHALTMSYSEALLRTSNPREAEKILVAHARTHPDDPQVWYDLAETHGLAGNILDVHRARAEYFILNGALDQAERQLGYAINLADGDFHTTASISARLADIQEMRKEMDI